MITLHTYIT